MSSSSTATPDEQTLYAALELSKNSWLLAIQFPGRDSPSLHPIKGGDPDGLIAKLDAARQRLAKVSGQVPKVTLCYEAGYDGFWLARFLEPRGIDCRVMDPASLQVDRRARRVKTDRIDVEKLLHTLIAWCRGERHVCSMVVIPSVDEEDLRRCRQERRSGFHEDQVHCHRGLIGVGQTVGRQGCAKRNRGDGVVRMSYRYVDDLVVDLIAAGHFSLPANIDVDYPVDGQGDYLRSG